MCSARLTEPRNCQETDCEEKVEKEKHDCSYDTGCLASIRNGARKDGHAHTLSAGSEEHELATSKAINYPDRDQR